MANDRIHIKQLPDKTSILEEDFLVVENLEDTYKVKASLLFSYIDNYISNIKSQVNAELNKLSELESNVQKNETERQAFYERAQKAEEERQANFKNYEKRLSDMENTITRITDEYEKVIKQEEIRNTEFANIKEYINEVQTAESKRVAAESTRAKSEIERDAKFEDFKTYISKTEAAEKDRISSETERKNNELERIKLYNELLAIKKDVSESETKRKEDFNNIKEEYSTIKNVLDSVESAEQERVAAENERKQNETSRENYIDSIETAETNRVNNENDRKQKETIRVSNEKTRVSNEKERVAYYEEIKKFMDSTGSVPVYAHVNGSIYISDNNENPAVKLGGGTWELLFGPVRLTLLEGNTDPLAADKETNLPFIWIWRRTESPIPLPSCSSAPQRPPHCLPQTLPWQPPHHSQMQSRYISSALRLSAFRPTPEKPASHPYSPHARSPAPLPPIQTVLPPPLRKSAIMSSPLSRWQAALPRDCFFHIKLFPCLRPSAPHFYFSAAMHPFPPQKQTG